MQLFRNRGKPHGFDLVLHTHHSAAIYTVILIEKANQKLTKNRPFSERADRSIAPWHPTNLGFGNGRGCWVGLVMFTNH